MTHLDNGTIVTDLDNDTDNTVLLRQGYTVRHVETFHNHNDQSFITWDTPQITETDLPF